MDSLKDLFVTITVGILFIYAAYANYSIVNFLIITILVLNIFILKNQKNILCRKLKKQKQFAEQERLENLDLKQEIELQAQCFTQTLIHDLKVPTLAQLRGLDLIKSESIGKLNYEQHEMVNQIQDSCNYIIDMISKILNTYQIEANLNNLTYEKFNMIELVLECFEENSQLTTEKGLTFVLEGAKKAIEVEADKNEIRKVIENLLSNAIIYSNRHEKILVNINSDNDSLSLSIISNGIALTSYECSSMFDRFSFDKPRYATVGQGISLYLCKKIIDMHNGKIFALTDENTKNTFTFVIPLNPQFSFPQNSSISINICK